VKEREIPNPKFQITNNFQNPNIETAKQAALIEEFEFGFCLLGFIWDLVLGIWYL